MYPMYRIDFGPVSVSYSYEYTLYRVNCYAYTEYTE